MAKFVYEVMSGDRQKLPIIFHTDTIKFNNSSNWYANWHENIEILACISGSGILHCDAESYEFSVGDVLVINSNALHSASSTDGVVYHCLIIDNSFCKENGIDMTKLHFKTLIKDPELYSLLLDIADRINKTRAKEELYSAAHVRAGILSVMVTLCRDYLLATPQSNEDNVSIRIKKAVTYINNNYSTDITLDTLASFVGVSKYHLSREFKRLTGRTIFEYIIALRCKLSRRFMKDGMSVSESAISAGFDNLSYFSRKFFEIYGILPSDYMKAQRKR